ncbi:DUF4241 domain-containing protein [Williamsia sp.]|uniref:DUF4241 domain-containing protein n=1 Tax=Williamsia sp. TaxID=1872085 RepID=UPI001A1B2AFB|nr:DUF4241 domain-containing protein [Williamsia sp.]MBJ7288998.1 DUF4241 domain-containing protein [Williamsia sp.]
MSSWVKSSVDVLQLLVNVGALVGGAVIWKLYVDKLQAALTSKDAEISSVEKNRDMWKDMAQELEKRSPEHMEKILSERISIREQEIERLIEDKDRNAENLARLRNEQSALQSDLSRTRGFRLMLALEEGYLDEQDEVLETDEVSPELTASDIEVVLLGAVGVDSGQLMITDPCYIDGEWIDDADDIAKVTGRGSHLQVANEQNQAAAQGPFSFSYSGAVNATLTAGYGELAYRKGHAGAGVVFSTAWGDGFYPVYGEMHDGRIVRVYITSE